VLKKSRKIFSNAVEEKDREKSAGGEERGRGVLMSSTIEETAKCGDTFVPTNLRLDLVKRNNKKPIIHVISSRRSRTNERFFSISDRPTTGIRNNNNKEEEEEEEEDVQHTQQSAATAVIVEECWYESGWNAMR
jgi:hypothetical protein